MGNGRATVIRFVQEGAKVFCVDKDLKSAEETVADRQEGGEGRRRCRIVRGGRDARSLDESDDRRLQGKWGRIDILHYNVGFSIAGGDAPPTEITEEAFDRIMTVNLRGMVMAVKHVLPVMRAQKSGVILGISSLAAWEKYPYVTYKISKSAMVAYQPADRDPERRIRHPLAT